MKVLNFFKTFYLRLWRRGYRPKSTNYYRSIYTLPAFNWLELNKTGDLKNLQIDQAKPLTDEVVLAYYAVKNEYFSVFGLPGEYEKHLKSLKHYGMMLANYLESGGKGHLLTHIQIAKIGLESAREAEAFDYHKMWALVISRMAAVPDIKKISTFDFMSMYKALTNG